jgi:signal transduction histidine kinase
MEGESKHVLLIEDNPGDADLVRLRLMETTPPVRVECVTRMSDALTSLAAAAPALVLLDLNLPDSHGAETFRRVMEKAPNVPVVILSGQEDEKLAMKALHHGVQDYLIKSEITSKQLDRAVHYAIERQSLLYALDMTRKQQLEFKNQFLSHVSHELRTPLTCIHQYVTILLDELAGPLAPEQSEHLGTILKSVNQLHAMIRDLLEATRADSGKLRIEQRCISIGDLIVQALSMMRPTADKKHIVLEAVIDPAIPLVYADPDRILEVLINLLDNGLKFTPAEGSVVVKASMLETDPSGVYVSVTDTGRGVSPQVLPRIFERLFQDSEAADGSRNGLGLGLYIAKEIITLHGARMWAASEPGSGSTFSFHLPVFSLARLLSPVITEEGRLRPAFALLRVDLKPLTTPPLGNWRDSCEHVLEVLRRCVYVDKDLVLPSMGNAKASGTFFIVASTDMDHVEIMIRRIREQLNGLPQLRSAGTLELSAQAIGEGLTSPSQTLEQQVQSAADRLSEMILTGLAGQQNSPKKESGKNGTSSGS